MTIVIRGSGLWLLLVLLLPAIAWGQGSRADYERAAGLERATAKRVFRQRVEPHWVLGQQTRFWYPIDTGPGKREFLWVDAERGERRLAFDHARLAESLGNATGRPVKPDQLPVERLEMVADGRRLRLVALGHRWELDFEDYSLRELKADAGDFERLEPLKTPRRSAASDQETAITFLNRWTAELELFWVPPTGEERSYGIVPAGERREQHTFAGHVWRVADRRGATRGMFTATEMPAAAVIDAQTPLPRPAPADAKRDTRHDPDGRSPDGRWQASLDAHNVWLVERAERVDPDPPRAPPREPLTRNGTADDTYAGPFVWSPDSRYLVAWQVRTVEPRKVHVVESSPRDQLQPKLHTFDYAKPGDPVPQRRPRLFSVAERRVVPIDDALVENSWSVGDARWSPDSSAFTFVFHQRGHQLTRVLAIDAATGQARTVIEERCSTFFDYAHKQFLHFLEATREALWMSERDGWNHLYLYDTVTGQLKNAVTHGTWVVRGVERVDDERRQVWIRVGGIHPDQDPYHVHLARVNFDGTGLTTLTAGDGTHRWQFSPDGRFFLDTWSRVDQPPVTELRRSDDGGLVCELERADATALLATGWRAPERFVAKGRDGATDIYGIVIRPTNFDASRRWPVVEQIYAGPQAAFVPKEWGLQLGQRQLAELGFVVVQIDGMGTAQRSKAFHDVCHKNLGDAGFPDRIAWIRALGAQYPELDLSRVGLYGGSAGGQNAVRGLLAHGDFYRVAVADCGCHDNRMDKIWWNELWMGWPIGPHYAEQSNVTQAHRLTGKLLLVVGELDRNVDPASTMQVVDALVRADKDFDLLVIPGAGHGAAETPYGRRRRGDFFTRHLLRLEPRGE